MPRQLPWLNKGSKIKTQVKAPPKAAKKAEVPSDIDDDFFAGTILETSRNGKERAQSQESDDDLPALPAHSSRKGKGKEPIGRRRVPSSSPPPIVAQLPPPAKELMRPGVDKFDLRDDEWRMVEDEFLHTAKLFTQHLHLEEYELLKKNMEEKKAVARPVVRDAKPSVESQFKERAKTQGKAQRRAMKDFFRASPPRDDGKEDGVAAAKHSSSKQASTTAAKPRPLETSDSDDLDAPVHPSKRSNPSNPPQQKPSSSSTSFPKPASRSTRPAPFDFLDEEPPRKRFASPPKPARNPTSCRSISPAKPSHTSTSTSTSKPRPSRPFDLLDELDFARPDPKRKEQAERLAKRRAEREKEKETEQRKAVNVGDIPTFLF